MQVTTTTLTVAEYCGQMKDRKIVVNRDYQRSPRIWPQGARSYLIDTILSGYPVPKLTLYQKTDLKSRTTVKEIVDGQQRSLAILDFYEDKLRITSVSEDFKGNVFSDLEDAFKQKFIDYPISIDLIVGATDKEIRQMFKRFNSYTVPLNAQEKRHAVFQGQVKWFVMHLADDYDDALKTMGVFTEHQINRMADTDFFSQIAFALEKGIDSKSEPKLDSFYKSHEEHFEHADEYKARIDQAFSQILSWQPLHNGQLMKPFIVWSMALAITHVMQPISVLAKVFPVRKALPSFPENALVNLSMLAASLEDPTKYPELGEFVKACSETTDRITNRTIRFQWFCRALTRSSLNETK